MNRQSRVNRIVTMGAGLVIALAIAVGDLVLGVPSAAAASCNGASHQTTLTAGAVSPGSGNPSTIFAFSVRYADTAGCAPSTVTVTVPGQAPVTMTASRTSFRSGVVFTASIHLPAGVWTYRFEAVSGSGAGQRTVTLDLVSPATITVTAPRPTPAPTPRPTPAPTPRPSPPPTPKPTPKTTAKPPPASAKPTPKPSQAPPSAGPAGGANGGSSLPPGGGSGSSGSVASPITPPETGIDGGGRAPWDSTPDGATLITGGIDGWAPVIAWLATTMLGVLVFGWTLRRPQRGDDSALANALSMVAAHARFGGGTKPPDAPRSLSNPEAAGSETTDELGLPVGTAVGGLTGNRPTGWQSRPALLFDSAPAGGAVRRRITYRLVRLSDAPDDLLSREIMRLDRGDEVEIVGHEGTFLKVATPTGAIGWIPSISIIG